jgi:3'(2'), 5'-bisphosphate nucleotidase
VSTPWSDHRLSAEMGAALDAVRDACQLCSRVQAQIDKGSLEKKDRSPVTVADFGSQALICHAIHGRYYDDPIIGEEDSAALREPGNEALRDRVVEELRYYYPGIDADTTCQWIDLRWEQGVRASLLDP